MYQSGSLVTFMIWSLDLICWDGACSQGADETQHQRLRRWDVSTQNVGYSVTISWTEVGIRIRFHKQSE